MKELYERYIDKFSKAGELQKKYSLSTEKAETAINDIKAFKVTVPLIGGFSTGKSSLINATLKTDLLSTDITPETAIPAEISYGADGVCYHFKDRKEKGSLAEFQGRKLSADTISLVEITLENAFLKEISGVKIVDMPGFDSGYKLHNKAIDDYLPKSLAYIITVSADEGTVRESILNFLNELKLNEMPVYLVITKSDKVPPDELEETVTHIQKTVSGKLNIQILAIAVTSADDEETEEFEKILYDVQRKSDEIFQKHFSERLCSVLTDSRTYLTERLKVKDNTLWQMEDEIENLENSIADMQQQLETEKQRFEQQCTSSIEAIKNKVMSDLRSSSAMLENLLYQGNDIGDKVNNIVRGSITKELHDNFEPKIRRYAKNVDEIISRNIVGTDTSAPALSADIKAENQEIKETAQGLITPVTTIITTVLGTALAGTSVATALGLGSVVLGPIGAIVGIALSGMINRRIREREELQKRELVREKISQLFRELEYSVGTSVMESIESIREKVNHSIEETTQQQIALKRKILEDTREQLRQSEQEKTAETLSVTEDLQTVEAMIQTEKGTGYGTK